MREADYLNRVQRIAKGLKDLQRDVDVLASGPALVPGDERLLRACRTIFARWERYVVQRNANDGYFLTLDADRAHDIGAAIERLRALVGDGPNDDTEDGGPLYPSPS